MFCPVVSIIVPVFNAEKHIKRCIDSVIRQSYKNLEILLVDDGSCDKSGIICNDYAIRDRRIRVIHKENGGVASARNLGLQNASGEYIMFVDSDDWIEKNMLEVLYTMVESKNADAACCVLQEDSDIPTVEQMDVVDKECKAIVRFCDNKTDSGLALLSVWGPVCKLYRKDVIGDCRFEDYKVAEDLLFNTKVICSNRFEKCVLVEYPFYHYIIYPGSAMKQKFQEKYLVAMEVEKKCYDMLTAISDKFADINLIGCAVSRVFEKYAQLSTKERKKYKADFKYCKKFAWEHRKQLLSTTNRHRKISGALKVYVPDLYLLTLIKRYK